jgi:hypothetical protein
MKEICPPSKSVQIQVFPFHQVKSIEQAKPVLLTASAHSVDIAADRLQYHMPVPAPKPKRKSIALKIIAVITQQGSSLECGGSAGISL